MINIQTLYNLPQALVVWNYHPPPFFTLCLHNYFQWKFFIISSPFPLFIIFVPIYPNNRMVTTRARGMETPPFFYCLFTYLFSVQILYYFISFFLYLSYSRPYIQSNQSYGNNNLPNCTCRPYIHMHWSDMMQADVTI